MKRIIGIAVCLVMAVSAGQLHAQKHERRAGKQQKQEMTHECKCPNCPCGKECKCHMGGGHEMQGTHQGMHQEHQGMHQGMHRGMRAEQLKEHLGLNEDQFKRVVEAEQAHIERMKAMNVDREKIESLSEEDRMTLRNNFEELRSEYDSKLRGIFDETQWLKYQELGRRERRDR